jgi:hypothetical protein
MMRTWKGSRGLSAVISRTNPGRLANSAPEIPSSTKMHASGTVQPLRVAYAVAWSICRVTLFASSETALWSVDFRA